MKSSMTFIQSNGWTEIDLILKQKWRRFIWWQVSFKSLVYIDMKHDWKKATLIPAVAAKDRDASNFIGGHLLRKAVRHPSWKILVIILYELTKDILLLTQWKTLEFFIMANSRNADLTGKQHSRHQQFWRFQLSPLEASIGLPRSRGHLFSHSMSKASLPQWPDLWYLTF